MLRAGYAWSELRRCAAAARFCLLWLATLACAAGCEVGTRRSPGHAASDARQVDDSAALLPRVPSHDANVTLYARVSNLAFGSAVGIVANHTTLPPVTHDGVVPLLVDVPVGTLYDVALPTNPRGQVCTIAPLHGAVGPRTPYVEVRCGLSVVTANDVNDSAVVGQVDDATVTAQNPPSDATLLAPWGKVFSAIDGTMFVADRGNQRVVGYYPAPLSGASATTVLGQNDDFTANAASGGTLGFQGPSGVGGGNALLLVADTNNNRVLMYMPTAYGQVDPAQVVGQANFGTTSPGCGPAGLSAPSGVVTSGKMLLVTDTGNHRVLIWNTWPTGFGTAADVALGQVDLASCQANQGAGLPSEGSLSNPQDVWTDQNRIGVADTGNRRVLIWLSLPVTTGQVADLAVGQADLFSGGAHTTSATSLNGPVSVVFDDNTLFVADSVDHRVLAFNPFPTSSGVAASYALGQRLATDHLCNQGNLVAAYTLCQPTGVSFVAGDLAVTDSRNNRVLIFYSDPNAAGVGSFSVVVTPGSSFFAPRLFAGDATAGEAATATVTALNYAGQVNTAYAGTVVFASTDPNAILPSPYTYSLGEVGVHEFNVTFFGAATHVLSVYDARNAGSRGVDPDILVVADEANYMAVSGFPTDPSVGQQGNVIVTAYDTWHNVATGFGGTVTFSSSDSNAVLPPPYTYVAADAGTHAFAVWLVTPGNQNITVNANGLAIFAGIQENIIVASPLRLLGGAVSGLITGHVTLTNTRNNDVISVGNGNYLFDQNVTYGQTYNVVATSPSGQVCTVANGNAIMATGGAHNVWITCVPRAYTLGGIVTGLPTNTNVTLLDNSDTVAVGNGNFGFPTSVAYNSHFSVSLTNPSGYTCVFTNNSNVGVMPASSAMNILVACSVDAYSLGGAISGLLANTNLTLSDGNDTVTRANGPYMFPTSLPYARVYSIGLTSPNGQNCVFNPNAAGSGTMNNANVTNANVVCSTHTYRLGGAVTGLVTGNITLTNTVNADAINVGNGNYIFDQNVAYAGNYNVVAAAPNGLICNVTNGNAVMAVGGEFNIYVACTPKPYPLGGAVSGLLTNTNVTLQNSVDTVSSGNGNFTFPTGVTYNSNFSASLTNPSGQMCVFSSNSNVGVMPPSTDTNILVVCTTNLYGLGGAISGLLANTNVTLSDGNDTVSYTNGSYMFPTSLPYASAYSIGIINPNGQTCVFDPNAVGASTMTNANVTNANVMCSTNTYPLGGAVTGLVTGNITLTNTVNADAIIVGNGNYIFDQKIAYAGNYNVVAASPNGLTCTVTNGNAVMAVAGEFNVYVTCAPKPYTLGGNISGLLASTTLFLHNGADTLSSGNGNFTFPTGVAYNSNFSVSLVNPTGQTCGFTGNSDIGVMPATADLNVLVTCTTNNYSLGGAVSGLLSNTYVTLADGNDTVSLANGAYMFPTSLPYARAYSVGMTNPNGQTCVFNPNAAGSGTMNNANVTNANVVCTANTYTLGGSVSGLLANTNVTLVNGADMVTPGNGNFTFPTPVAYNGNFSASLTNPPGQTCVFTSNSNVGVMPASTDMNILVSCTTNAYSLGGTISGLLTNTNVTLADGNDTISRTNGAYTFTTLLPYGRAYSIGFTNPMGQTCAFNPNSVGSGTMSNAPVTNANVTCTTNTYPLSGAVTGLVTGNITLSNMVNADVISVGNGNYVFDQNIAYTSNYNVVAASPNGLTCTVTNGNTVMAVGGESNVYVTCLPKPYTLGGTVTGLLSNTNVTLQNGADSILSGNGNFIFPTGVTYNSNFSASLTNPTGQTCTFGSNSNTGVMPAIADANIRVGCTTNTYTLGGSVSGLLANTNVTLVNGVDTLTPGNGNFTFPTSVAYNGNFSASLTNPPGQTCVFTSNSNVGVMPASTDMNILVSCTTNAYSLGGTISGLLTNTNVTLADGNDTISRTNGAYTFTTLLPYGRAYSIGFTNPTGQTCAFNPNSVGSGTMAAAPVSNANVACTTNTYPLGGSVTGLINGNVTLTNAVNADAISVGNGNYLFDQNVAYAGNYNVVATSPNGQTCTVQNGNAVMVAGGNFNVSVTCAATSAAYLTLSTYSTPRTAGQNSNINITAYDSLNHVAIGYTGTVHLTATDPNAIFGNANFTFVAAYAGSANVPITMKTSGTQSVTGNDTVSPTIAGRQTSIVVNPNIATTFALANYTTPRTAGLNSNITVTAYDFYNNIATGYTGTVHFTITDTHAVSPNFTFVTAYAGSANIPITMTTAGTWSITGNDTVATSIAGRQTSIVVTQGNANYYLLTGYPNPATACQQNNVTVTVYDAYANIATSYTGTIALSSSDTSAEMAGNYTFVAGDSGTKAFPVTMHTVGSWNIKGNDTVTPSVTGAQNAIVVKPNSATYYTLSGYPNPATAGQQSNVILGAYDACGNLDTNYLGTVHITSTDGNAVLAGNHAFIAADAGVTSMSVMLKTSGGQNINANDTVTASISGQQNVLVNPNVSFYYKVINYPTQTNIAAQANVWVAAYDFYSNVATNYTGTVQIRSTDGNATLPANYTFNSANAGVAKLPVRLNSWGTWAISANDTVTASIAGQQGNILVAFTPMNPAPSGTNGLNGQVWHRGNTSTGADPPQLADLGAQYNYGMVTAPNDVFVNTNVNSTRHLSYSGSTSTATNSYLGSDAAGPASSDSSVMYSTSFMYSGYMVVAAGGNYTIATTGADDGVIAYIGGGPQGGNTTLVTLRNWTSGITTAPGYAQPAIFYLNQAGAYPLTIFHFNQSGGASLDFNMYGPAAVSFLPGPAPWVGTTTSFVVSMSPNPINAGAQGYATITPYDSNGLLSNYTGSITLTTGDTAAVIATPYSFSGTATVPVLFRRAGTWALTANDMSNTAVAGAQTGIVVNDTGAATYLTVAYSNVTASTSGTATVTAINASGTTATGYTGTVKLTSSDTNAILPANYTFTTANHGVASLAVTLKTISTSTTLTATDTAASTINGSATNIQVYPAPNATAPGGSTGLKGTVWHRLTDTSLGSPPPLADLATAAVWAYGHTANYTFTNSHVSSTLAFSYNGGDTTNTNTFLGSDAAGAASSDGNKLYTTYFDYTGYLHVSTSGNYNFILTTTDDGALVYLGGGTAPGITTLILAGNYGTSQLLTNFASPLVLHLPAAGYYPIEIFYENEYSSGTG